MKAVRNKTINITAEEGKEYLDKCVKIIPGDSVSADSIVDKTILGDTFEVLKSLPDQFVDLLIVDPPYNLNKDFGGNIFKSISYEEYEAYTDKWLSAAMHTLKKDASIYVCCDYKCSSAVERILGKYTNIRNRITWQREKGRGAKDNWKNGMEDIWYATVSDKFTFNVEAVKLRRKVIAPYKDKESGEAKDWTETKDGKFRDTYPSNFWDDISIPYWSMPENTAHPTQKPEKLIAKLILASSNEGDVILDPFAGSGTSLVTAKKLGRSYVGIEQNEQYCTWCEYRLDKASEDSSIQGYEDKVFWERNTHALQKKYRKRATKE